MTFSLLLLSLCYGAAAQSALEGTVRSEQTGDAIQNAVVEVPTLGLVTFTDEAGHYRVVLPPGEFDVHASALGHSPLSQRVEVPEDGAVTADFTLQPRPIRLRPLTALAPGLEHGGAAEREFLRREIAPGAVGISGQEVRDIPVLAEADVMRSLQALPDVTPLNALTARLHVQGGGPDQNLFLWDGTRVLAPYHMFGMFGAFNADAVGRVDFYRGHIPARYGGVLSSVVEIAPPIPTGERFQATAGLSLLGLRGTARGQLLDGRGQWLVSGRRTYADLLLDGLFDNGFPYGFYDVQARGSLRLSEENDLSSSGFFSSDWFSMFLDGANRSLASEWRNAAGSIRWGHHGASSATVTEGWVTHYAGSLQVGTSDRSPISGNSVTLLGLDLTRSWQGDETGYRAGVGVQGGSTTIDGADRAGGYVLGTVRRKYVLGFVHGEVEALLGPVRVAPGLRLTYEDDSDRILVEPRISARVRLGDASALTIGAARTYQMLSTLRDDRYVLPGAAFWLHHRASRSDMLSASVDGWKNDAWSVHVTAYTRSFEDVLRWRPTGTREVGAVGRDDGRGVGASVMFRRHEGRFTGWLAYGLSDVYFTEAETGATYDATWDRRHAIDAALYFHPHDQVTLSGRLIYGSGQPFWPRVGEIGGQRLSPLEGTIESGETYPVWGTQQLRLPDYYRLDGSVRVRFSVLGYEMEGYASMLNLRLRPNVLFYELAEVENADGTQRPALEPVHWLYAFPSIGFNVRF